MVGFSALVTGVAGLLVLLPVHVSNTPSSLTGYDLESLAPLAPPQRDRDLEHPGVVFFNSLSRSWYANSLFNRSCLPDS